MADELEELNVTPEETPSPTAPAPSDDPGPLPTPSPSGKAFPQLYRFFWGGLIVFVGALLPFGPDLVSNLMTTDADAAEATDRVGNQADADARKKLAESLGTDAATPGTEVAAAIAPLAPAKPGFHTFVGALFLLFGLMLMGQMYSCIRDRKVALGGVLLMFFPAGWTWLKLIQLTGDMEWFSWGDAYLLKTWEFLARDVGSGFLLILGGSTYVVLNFLMAIFGAASGGKKDAAPAAAAGPRARGAASRRR